MATTDPGPVPVAAASIVFLDVDGTMVAYDHAQRAGVAAFLDEHRDTFDVTIDEFLPRWQAVADRHVRRYLDGEITWAQQRCFRLQDLFADAGVELSDERASALYETYLHHHRAAWRLFDDVLGCLGELEHVAALRLGVISNGDGRQQRRKLRALGVVDRFSPVVISGEVGPAKPDRRIFAEACRLAGLPPSRCAYVGDRLDHDARAARAAGLQGIWLDRTGQDEPQPADVPTIHTLADLPALIRPWLAGA